MSSFEVDYEKYFVPRIRNFIDGYSREYMLSEYALNVDDSYVIKNKDIYYGF